MNKILAETISLNIIKNALILHDLKDAIFHFQNYKVYSFQRLGILQEDIYFIKQ